jgi:enoyl-[acyl-carrier protein] reductase III
MINSLATPVDFQGTAALVTGGTRGLGRAISLALASGGASVAMNYRRNEAAATQALGEIRRISPRSILIKADLEDEAAVRAMVAEAVREFGRLDILIANAAATAFRPLLEVKPHNLARTFNLSVGGFVAAVQEASKAMGNGGRVVMISGLDSVRHLPGHGVLGAAKAALESMVRDFAFELGPRGITVNGINLGYIDTESARFYSSYLKDDFETFSRTCAERSALKRLPTLEEIANMVCLVCSAEASYLTAQTIMVDGGFSLNFPAAR